MLSMNSELCGQWTGPSEGQPAGRVVLDIEFFRDNMVGVAQIFPDEVGLPATSTVYFDVESALQEEQQIAIEPFDPKSGRAVDVGYTDTQHADHANIRLVASKKDQITANWRTEIGTFGTVKLTKTLIPSASRVEADPKVINW